MTAKIKTTRKDNLSVILSSLVPALLLSIVMSVMSPEKIVNCGVVYLRISDYSLVFVTTL